MEKRVKRNIIKNTSRDNKKLVRQNDKHGLDK